MKTRYCLRLEIVGLCVWLEEVEHLDLWLVLRLGKLYVVNVFI